MPQKILLVDDDLSSIRLMSNVLMDLGAIQFATSGQDALRLIHEQAPSVIVLDSEMPGMGGFELCQILKSNPVTAEIPVVFVTSHATEDFQVTGFDLGAADFIAKPVSPVLLLARVRTQLRLAQATSELHRVATTDALTQVPNRGRFDEVLQVEWARCRRAGEALCLMMIDIDHFKEYNDHYGHPAGDACLMRVAQALRAVCLRPGDMVARYGGEEFVLLMPKTARAGGMHMASRVLAAIADLGLPHAASLTANHVTVSVGLGIYDAESPGWQPGGNESRELAVLAPPLSAEDLTRAADRALYAAKVAGRARAYRLDVGDLSVAPSSVEFTAAN